MYLHGPVTQSRRYVEVVLLTKELYIADIPLSKVVSGVRVGMIDGQPVINPSSEQQSKSKLDLVMAGTSDAILMIEGFCDFLTDQEMLTVRTQPHIFFAFLNNLYMTSWILE